MCSLRSWSLVYTCQKNTSSAKKTRFRFLLQLRVSSLSSPEAPFLLLTLLAILNRVAHEPRTSLSFKIADDRSRQIYLPNDCRKGEKGKSVKIGSYHLISLVYLFLVKHILTNADFVVPFRNQIVIKDSFTDINVGTMKWIRVEPETTVNWILKEVQCYFR